MSDLDPIDKARKAVTERAELPGMSLMEHLTELRKRLIHSVYYLIGGFIVAYIFHVRLYNYIQRPVTDLGLKPSPNPRGCCNSCHFCTHGCISRAYDL